MESSLFSHVALSPPSAGIFKLFNILFIWIFFYCNTQVSTFFQLGDLYL